MQGNIFLKFFSLFFFLILVGAVMGQTISDMKISVSAESLTVLRFNSRITRVEFGNRSGYTTQVRDDNNSLVIKTYDNTATNTNLYVTEGKRGHMFNVVYLPVIDINHTKLYYDFSDLKKLKKMLSSSNQEMGNNMTPDQPEDSVIIMSEEDKHAQYIKDSTDAAEAKKKADAETARQAKAKADSIKARQEEDARLAKAKLDAEAAQKAEELRLAKAKADAEAAQKAEDLRLAKAKADAEAAQKKEDLRLAKARADAEAAQKVQEEKLAKAKAAAEAAKKAEEVKLVKAKSDSILKAYREELLQARLDSIKRQKGRNDSLAKAKLDSIQAKKALNAQLAKMRADSIQAQKVLNAQLATMRADSIQAKKEENARIAKAKLDSIQARKDELAKLALIKKKQADSLAALPKKYTHIDLWKKYPRIVFEDPPNNQHLAGDYFVTNDTLENANISYGILKDSAVLKLHSDTDNNVRFTVENILFKGVNCYMRIHIENKGKEDYLTGIMNLRWNSDSGRFYNAYPCFITSYPSQSFLTSFPVLAGGDETTIVLTTRALNVKKDDLLLLTIGDRLYKTNLELSIPAEQYLSIMDQTR